MDLPLWMGVSIAAVYGIAIGSFLNVCIYRLPAEQSIVNPPSHCPKCKTRLKGADLVPLFSFLLLGRKCRYCHAPISWRYFTIELITGIVFVLTYLKFGFGIDFYPYVIFLSALIVAFVVDMEQFIIPDQVWHVGLLAGLGRDIAHIVAGDDWLVRLHIPFTSISFPILPCVIGAALCFGLFFLIAYVSFYVFMPKDEESRGEYGGAMGFGDVKLAAAMGAVLGLVPAMVSFFIAVIFGTLIGVAMVIGKSLAEKKGVPWRTEIPFGPYMVLGALAVIFGYPQIQHIWEAWIRLVTPG